MIIANFNVAKKRDQVVWVGGKGGPIAQLGDGISQDRNFYICSLLGVELITAPQLSEYMSGDTVRFFWTKFNMSRIS